MPAGATRMPAGACKAGAPHPAGDDDVTPTRGGQLVRDRWGVFGAFEDWVELDGRALERRGGPNERVVLQLHASAP
ncbi:MAG: hypothetical protein VXX04_01425, partial [Actinomycetota bacterium]|nr:hypothetical protein [Actinomycetota bacterium]